MSDPSEDYHETRYARQQEKLKQQARHARIVRQLGKSIVDQFEEGLIALPEPTPCIAAGVPSEWADWDEYPENREPQESRMPTGHRAREMCEGCPMMTDDLCYRYALATDKFHGVWGGRRFHNGTVVSDGRDSPDTPNRERRS